MENYIIFGNRDVLEWYGIGNITTFDKSRVKFSGNNMHQGEVL